MLRKWLAGIVREELENAFCRHIELANDHAGTLHEAIAQLRQTHRAACSCCGKMTHEYVVKAKGDIRKVFCRECSKKGE